MTIAATPIPQSHDTLAAFRAERLGITLRALRSIQLELGCDPAIIADPEAAAYLLEQILHLARIVKSTQQEKLNDSQTS